jgi:hypothetical protein
MMPTKSVETYKEALIFLSKLGALIGFDLLSEDFTSLNRRIFAVIFDTVTYTMVTIYCIFEFTHDLEKLVFCLVTYGFATQVISNQYSAGFYSDSILLFPRASQKCKHSG